MVRMAAAQIETLCPQVINAARVLTARPRSKVALENMDVFKDAWERQVRLLMDAVDDITTINDFLAVSGSFLSVVSYRALSRIEITGLRGRRLLLSRAAHLNLRFIETPRVPQKKLTLTEGYR